MSSSTDRWRRGGALLIAVAVLVLAPQLAQARFGDSKSPTLEVGTARMVAPTDLSGTYRCSQGRSTEAVRVRITGFTDAGPAGARYTFSLLRSGLAQDSRTSGGRWHQLMAGQRVDGVATAWEVTVSASLGHWTGPPASVVVSCPSARPGTFEGTF